MPILLKDGKILVASGGRGLSLDCDCCDRPPESQGCEVCCPGDHQIGDSVLVSVDCTLPTLAIQRFSPAPQDNGVRIVPGRTLSGNGVLYISAVNSLPSGRVNSKCLSSGQVSYYQYSNATYSESILLSVLDAYPLDEAGEWSETSARICEVELQFLANVYVQSWLFGAGSDTTVTVLTDPDVSGNSVSYTFLGYFTLGQGQSPCSGLSEFPLLWLSGGIGVSYPLVDPPEQGTAMGTLTVLGIE